MASLPGKRDLQHRGDERRGKAVARNVSDEDAEVLVVNLDEVVEIAGHGSHGKKTSGDLQSGQLRNRGKKEVAADGSLDDRGGERLVDIIHGAHLETSGFIFGASLPSKEDDGDFAGGGIVLEARTNFVAVHAWHHNVEED